MRKKILFPFLVLAGLLFFLSLPIVCQGPPQSAGRQDERGRPNLLAALGLTPDQIQQIKQTRLERRPQLQEAVRKLREANRALDAAVYADVPSDIDFQIRLKEFQAAQAHVARLRFESELAIRKVLTPEQLTRFRELRRAFGENRDNLRRGRRGPGNPGGGRRGLKPPHSSPDDL